MTASGNNGGALAGRRGLGAKIATVVIALAAGATAIVARSSAQATTPPYDPTIDPYSMASLSGDAGAVDWWNAGYTGRGIDVALIDTGVSPVQGLSAPGKVIHGPDLSLESQAANLAHLDTNGHGTFMAGLIAGHDDALSPPYADAPATQYRGIAPDARIVSIKVGAADGGTDVSQVIAAINWVIQHRNDNGLNIRVISLSYGTNTTQSYTDDPLSYAVEQAWKQGIVVLAAAGNTGFQKGRGAPGLADPAYNPFVIAVGGYDSAGTVTPKDDVMGSYSASSGGCGGCRKPDFVAVGSHVQGLRVPNGFIDTNHPEGRLGDRYFRGSGTSQATAIAAGAVALVLQKYPSLSPDRVKHMLSTKANKVPGSDSQVTGGGEMNLSPVPAKMPGAHTQKFAASNGRGSLEQSRGQDHLTHNGVVLSGERDIFGQPFDSAAVAAASAAGSTWSGGAWNGSTWSGSTWSGSTWSGHSWADGSWS